MSLDALESHYSGIIKSVGENLSRDGLLRTPARAAKAMQYLCRGYNMSLEDVVNEAVFDSGVDDMVIVKDIELYSLCEHHILPFIGKAHVAYLPRGKVIGLSKIARIVDMYARRLQIQENLTVQIAEAIEKAIDPAGVAVTVEAEHLCMTMRGIRKPGSRLFTSASRGIFRRYPATRAEFFSILGMAEIGRW